MGTRKLVQGLHGVTCKLHNDYYRITLNVFYFELEGIRPIEKRQEVQIILEDDNPIFNDLIGLVSK